MRRSAEPTLPDKPYVTAGVAAGYLGLSLTRFRNLAEQHTHGWDLTIMRPGGDKGNRHFLTEEVRALGERMKRGPTE